MPKMRVRLMKLEDCQFGTRFFTFVKCRPQTLVAVNSKTCEAVYHSGFEFNIQATKYRITAKRKVWAVINFKDLP